MGRYMTSIEVNETVNKNLSYLELDFETIQFNHPVERDNCKYIDILDKNQSPLIFKTPELKVYNIVEKTDANIYLDLVIKEENKEFFEFIANIDDHVMLNIYNNCKRWFKKSIPLDVLDDFHRPVVKIKKSGNAIFRTLLREGYMDEEQNIFRDDKAVFTIKLEAVRLFKREFRTQWVVFDHELQDSDYEFGDSILDENSMYNLDVNEIPDEKYQEKKVIKDEKYLNNVKETIENIGDDTVDQKNNSNLELNESEKIDEIRLANDNEEQESENNNLSENSEGMSTNNQINKINNIELKPKVKSKIDVESIKSA